MSGGLAVSGILSIIAGSISMAVGVVYYSGYITYINVYGNLASIPGPTRSLAEYSYHVGIPLMVAGVVFLGLGTVLTVIGFRGLKK